MKSKRGFFGVGCIGMKTSENYGTLFRTANILGADFMFLIGTRFKKQCTDTTKSYRHIPTFIYKDFEDFNSHRPFGCELVGIELSDEAINLKDFNHPERCAYLLGAEDNGIPKSVLYKCNHLVVLDGEMSMNVAVAGSIVLYDRISKLK